MTTIEAKPNGVEVRVLRTATCPSLSGKSKLTYELGFDDKAGVQLRIAKNSGKGMFSAAWVPWERVGALLEGHGDKPVTSHSLWPLFFAMRSCSADAPSQPSSYVRVDLLDSEGHVAARRTRTSALVGFVSMVVMHCSLSID